MGIEDEAGSAGPAAGGVTVGRHGLEVDRREHPPWRPERGELIRIPGTTISFPEWAGFAAVMIFAVALLIIALMLF